VTFGSTATVSALLLLAATGCAQQPSDVVETPSASATAPATPRPSGSPAAVLDYNPRVGSNRVAAAASLEVSRRLFREGMTWEVYLKTTPVQLPGKVDPSNPEATRAAGRAATEVIMVLATESGTTLKAFRAGGHDHEKAIIQLIADILVRDFPGARISGQVFYGESHQHAVASFGANQALEYKILDSL
jgi:hypothetical protein